jgi:hypothetical protein
MQHWSRYVFWLGLCGICMMFLSLVIITASGVEPANVIQAGYGYVMHVGGSGGMLFILCGIVLLAVVVSGLRRIWSQLDNATRWLAIFTLVVGHFGTSYLVYFLMRRRFFSPDSAAAS